MMFLVYASPPQTHTCTLVSTSAKLEIFSLDLASPGLDMPLLGAIESPQRYECTTVHIAGSIRG